MNNKLIIRKLNCANGIKGLKIDKEPLVLENAAIYSFNGCFKTSFTNAIYNIKNGIAVEDRISYDKCVCDIDIGDTSIDKSDVPVITFF